MTEEFKTNVDNDFSDLASIIEGAGFERMDVFEKDNKEWHVYARMDGCEAHYTFLSNSKDVVFGELLSVDEERNMEKVYNVFDDYCKEEYRSAHARENWGKYFFNSIGITAGICAIATGVLLKSPAAAGVVGVIGVFIGAAIGGNLADSIEQNNTPALENYVTGKGLLVGSKAYEFLSLNQEAPKKEGEHLEETDPFGIDRFRDVMHKLND